MARKIYTQEQLELFEKEELDKLEQSILLLDGREIPSSKKLFQDVHEGSRNSLKEQVERILRNYHVKQQLANQGFESFEESDDFDVDDDEEPISPYEIHEMIEETIDNSAKTLEEINDKDSRAQDDPRSNPDQDVIHPKNDTKNVVDSGEKPDDSQGK